MGCDSGGLEGQREIGERRRGEREKEGKGEEREREREREVDREKRNVILLHYCIIVLGTCCHACIHCR